MNIKYHSLPDQVLTNVAYWNTSVIHRNQYFKHLFETFSEIGCVKLRVSLPVWLPRGRNKMHTVSFGEAFFDPRSPCLKIKKK